MRRQTAARLAIAVLAVAFMGAPCSTTGPQPRDFRTGSLVIPMDNCYQKRDANSAAGGQTQSCNTASDDGIFRAYGLVYYLLKKGVTVYWAIDGATPKATPAGPDIVVPAPAAGQVVKKFDWGTGQVVAFAPAFPDRTGITYVGGPFVIDSTERDTVIGLLNGDPDLARFRSEKFVDIHEVESDFHANQVLPLSGPPPRVAILNIRRDPTSTSMKTSVNVMYEYAVAAGLSWPCTGNGDCAGGVTGNGVNTAASPGQGCDLAALYAYLASPNGDPAIPRVNITGGACLAGQTCAPTFNAGPGLVYDILCDNDFYAPSGAYADTALARNAYKLLWAPHWEEEIRPNATPAVPPVSQGDVLGAQLASIAAFVNAGGNLFAECHAIFTLEGGTGSSGTEYGLDITRFQSTASMTQRSSSASSAVAFSTAAIPDPNMQVGDFVYSVTTGSVSAYLPNSPPTQYRPGVKRLITETPVSTGLDVSTSRVVTAADGAVRGSVAYLGGHRYAGQTAGTRIVLNTLFNLGFACADPNTTCATGYPSNSACATGVLKCSGSGGFVCVPNVEPGSRPEICGNGIDDNCDGQVDEGCAGTCTPNQTRSCDGGAPPAQVCTPGTQTCSALGIWGACEGLRLKSPEACNGVDDDCNGQVDEGVICPFGQICTNGVCLPEFCNLEVQCPGGYGCVGTTCTPLPCGGGPACGTGKVCSGGTCVDPCASVHCGPGSTCSGGVCFGGACYGTGCPSGQLCQRGQCLADPCSGISCPTGTFCRAGTCVRSCSVVACAPGEHCGADGFCEPGAACAASCGSGRLCQGGQCVPDPACANLSCALGQVCRGGSCLDNPCNGVACPSGTCADGQCPGGATTSATVPKEAGKGSGCGCGSAGGLDLLGLLGAVALWPGLRRASRARRRAVPLGLGAAAALALGASACGKSAADRCPSASTPCGTLCCASGYSCSAGSCLLGTANPVILSLSPSRAGVGTTVTLTVTGEGFQSGAQARLAGLGLPASLPLDVTSATSATLANLDLSQAAPGTAEIRVVNPAPSYLASNAATLALTSDPVPVGVSPPSFRQDAAPLAVRVSGSGLGAGLLVTLSKTGFSQDFIPSAVSAQEATVQVDPAALPIGVYDVTLRFTGGSPSPAVKLAVVEGQPATTSMTPTCGVPNSTFTGALTGSFVYPSSTVHVSGAAVPDSPLITRCAQATPAASGQCQGGQLEAVVDLSGVATGDYQVWVVNPGVPALASTPALTFRVASACP